jgi:myo-inositol-1(or 4)-monophosphatase
MNTNDAYLKTSVSAAAEAGVIFKKYFGKPKTVKAKDKNYKDLVTEVDLKIEKAIRKKISKQFPSHSFLGEEMGSDSECDLKNPTWIIDPIDGTSNFIHGIPLCCVSIALWENKKPLVAVVYNPTVNEMFIAQKGKGSFLNGKKIKVSAQNRLIRSYGGFGWGREVKGTRLLPFMIKNAQKIRTFGTAAWELCQVAKGSFDFHVQTKFNLWDFAAAALVVMEAGGKVTDLKGKEICGTTTSIIASNGKIHKELLKTINV